MVRNTIGFGAWLGRIRGSPIDFDLRPYAAALADINSLGPALRDLSEQALASRAHELAAQARAGASLDGLATQAFAVAREVADRTLALRPFDVQVVAALALHAGHIVEMQTGEGKTLAAVLPVFVNALAGKGVHVLTFNDYLARRDAEWMGPVYRCLGLSVEYVQAGMSPVKRRRAYAADITYVTAKESGFDHLRDLLATEVSQLVHRAFHLAVVDEADSLLIDEARVPLVIAGRVDARSSSARELAAVAASLERGVEFDTDEYDRNVELTEAGLARVERVLGRGSLHTDENYVLLTELNCALHARALLKRDVDYIVRDGTIELVDKFTGRVVDDRHWPDGLQAALEAKEGVERRPDGQILASVTLQNFLRGYPHLCGMTWTAQAAAEEFKEFYGLRTAVIPTHRPMIRADHTDVIFTHQQAKENAVVEEIRKAHATRRPLLVGTLTVDESERLAQRLADAGVRCEVLNAARDAEEAAIIGRAGALDAVTISTNMAGRGTDIKLGGPDEADRDAVVSLGGLYVIGTDKHESHRVDQQLRGRAGRQGDPGDSRFFVSLEDDLLVKYGVRSLIPAPLFPDRQDDPVESPVVLREVARAQRIIEGQNYEIRRTLSNYAMPLEEQRRAISERRQRMLLDTADPDVWQRDGPRYAALVASVGGEAAASAERAVTVYAIDRGWRDHLAVVADLREGIHLVRLGGGDPLSRFGRLSGEAFQKTEEEIDRSILDLLARVEVSGGKVDLTRLGIKGPSSTWTYLINDDPFRHQLGLQLIGPGGTTFATGAAIVAMPLFMLMGVVTRYLGKKGRRV